MIFNKPFKSFSSEEEKLEFLKKYGLVSPKSSEIKAIYYKGRDVSTPCLCSVIGYEHEYSDSATLVIDYGKGTCFIQSGFLKQMQTKGFSLDSDNY